MSELRAIDQAFEKSLDSLGRVRWIGSNGAWQLGLLLFESDGTWVALSEHTRTIVTLADDEFEHDLPKDDAGNPK